ncbi:ATPase AAA [Gordoniibacillus kamchatkensis]|uniref:ATPase AAA n=1 Tax=Gordoniibacillus kamchatkensis TaxID=1590651 RepID=A0ABR5AJN0_9BACL|nr:ATP-binding protein [Paenibacillus sp. VKM B-2647]KIL41236.1 ATPase AAA [Paenibacillus sp. VKM B-2647]
MESLSSILKQLPYPSVLQQAEERARLLLADPLIVKFRQKYPFVDEHTMKINMNSLYQYVKEYKTCMNCPGLDKCPNDMTGHYTMLSADLVNERPYIREEKVSCKKYVAHQMQMAIQNRIRTFHIDEKALQYGYSFEDVLEKDPDREEAVGQIGFYIKNTIENGLQPRGLFLTGSFGTGKTFLMCYMLYQLAKVGLTGAIVYMPDFAEDLKGMFQDSQKLRETIELLKETDLLVFDDIGAENLNPWLRDHVVGAILNYRMNRKPTFFTSNYDLDGLERHFSFTNKDGEEEHKGLRIMDRIRPFVDVVAVGGYNKRGV